MEHSAVVMILKDPRRSDSLAGNAATASTRIGRWPHGYKERPPVPYTRFRCVTARMGQFPRRERGAIIFTGSTPELYGH
jgi:hypothetical protein